MDLFIQFFTSPLMRSMAPGYLVIAGLFSAVILIGKPVLGPWLGIPYNWREAFTTVFALFVALPLGYFGLCLFLTLA